MAADAPETGWSGRHGRTRPANGAIEIVTAEECYTFPLEVPAQALRGQPNERYRVKLAIRVFSGRIVAGIFWNDRREFYRYEMTSPANGDDWQILELVTPRLSRCGSLVIGNASPEGASRGEARLIEVTREPSSRIPSDAPVPRTVHVIDNEWSSGTMQQLYFDKDANWLRPNLTFLNSAGTVVFETNEIGLKGDPLDPSRRHAVVWGDSVTFGLGRGWPCLLDNLIPGYQFLNGGIEGDAYSSVLERAVELNSEREIALNIILLGWHPHGHNEHVRADLHRALDRIKNPVLATMPTALNGAVVDKDLSSYFAPGPIDDFFPEQGKVTFYFYGSYEYSRKMQQDVYRYILERNQLTREVAAEKGMPLIDLFAALNAEPSGDFREDFFDVMHPRPAAYAKIARIVADRLTPLLAAW